MYINLCVSPFTTICGMDGKFEGKALFLERAKSREWSLGDTSQNPWSPGSSPSTA